MIRLHIYLYLIKQPLQQQKLQNIFQEDTGNIIVEKREELSILIWNIQYGNGLTEFNTLVDSINFMNLEILDICLLQEVMESPIINQTDIIKKSIGMKYHLFHHNFDYQNIKIGNLILSKYPLTLVINKKNYQIVKIKVDINGREDIYLINVHLNSDLICYKQKKTLMEIKKEIKYIKDKHKKNGIEPKIIMAGDFNLLSWCQNIQDINSIIPVIKQNQYTYPSNYPLVKYDYAFQIGFDKRISIDIPQVTYLTIYLCYSR